MIANKLYNKGDIELGEILGPFEDQTQIKKKIEDDLKELVSQKMALRILSIKKKDLEFA